MMVMMVQGGGEHEHDGGGGVGVSSSSSSSPRHRRHGEQLNVSRLDTLHWHDAIACVSLSPCDRFLAVATTEGAVEVRYLDSGNNNTTTEEDEAYDDDLNDDDDDDLNDDDDHEERSRGGGTTSHGVWDTETNLEDLDHPRSWVVVYAEAVRLGSGRDRDRGVVAETPSDFAWEPDGRTLALGMRDGSIRVWSRVKRITHRVGAPPRFATDFRGFFGSWGDPRFVFREITGA